MQTVIIIIHLMVVLALIGVVLIQRSEGGGLGIGGGGGGGGGFFSARGTANVLTRATAILATLFFITSLSLTILAGWGRGPSSIFSTPTTLPSGAPAAPGGNVLEQLQGAQPAPGTAPAAPAAPAAPTAPQVPQSQ